MAGSERSGLGAADPLLFQSALWVLCPPHDFPHERLEPIKALIAALGARGAILEPEQHDQAVARVSHVPQIVSTALSGWAGSDERLSLAALALAAGGFRDMTRLALSSWEMWRDILATNPAPIASGLHEVAQRLSDLADGVAIGELAPLGAPDGEEIFRTAFADGRAFREKFRMPRKGIARDLSEFVVRLEDRPGQLLALLSPLAEAGINVQDLEILKVREGETGTVLLGFGSAHERERARAALGDRFLVEDK
jgi:prephenate dehydrogenase